MSHTIAPEARATKVRKPGQAAFNQRGDRLVRRVTAPEALPYGTTVIDAVGDTFLREVDGWHLKSAKTPLVIGALSTLDLVYPLVVVDLKATHEHVSNRAGRRAERLQDRRDNRAARRFRNRRVRAFLDALAPEDRAKYAAALAPRQGKP